MTTVFDIVVFAADTHEMQRFWQLIFGFSATVFFWFGR
jgi:hypothetical protein